MMMMMMMMMFLINSQKEQHSDTTSESVSTKLNLFMNLNFNNFLLISVKKTFQ
jgi:hypothetical protein